MPGVGAGGGTLHVEPRQLLTPAGELLAGSTCPMSDVQLREALEWMLLSRAYDERATRLQRQGRFGVFSKALGQEAAIVGSALALDPSVDWIVPQYRELVAYLHHGYPLVNATAAFLGKLSAGAIPTGVNMLPIQAGIAAQLPHAVGLAWGLRLQKKDGVVIAYCGDGATSEGDFHESVNLAGVTHAPVIFFVQNNQWALSVPRSRQTAAPTIACRGEGYGIPGKYVDGNDIMAVFEATSEAVSRARTESGPTLIEAVTYRRGFHNTSDNPAAYEDPNENARAEQFDPMERLVAYLQRCHLLEFRRIEGDVSEGAGRRGLSSVGSPCVAGHTARVPVREYLLIAAASCGTPT